MGVYGLSWGAAFGIGPVIAGLLNDYIAPVAIWYGGLVMGLLAVAGFVLLTRTIRIDQDPQAAIADSH
jgi:MFS family permease